MIHVVVELPVERHPHSPVHWMFLPAINYRVVVGYRSVGPRRGYVHSTAVQPPLVYLLLPAWVGPDALVMQWQGPPFLIHLHLSWMGVSR